MKGRSFSLRAIAAGGCAIQAPPQYAPGEAGKKRIKESEYRNQLREKQKTKRIYGVLEKQFRHYYDMANRQKRL